MFDSGFTELLLIFIVALLVFGPERLPELARKAGYWIGKLRRYANTVRSEIERELNAEELRSMLSKQEQEIRELRDMLKDTRQQMNHEFEDIDQEVRAARDRAEVALAGKEHPPSASREEEKARPGQEETAAAASPPATQAEASARSENKRATS